MTLEQVRVLYTDREIWQAETYWQVEATVNRQGSASSAQNDATEAAFQSMKANKKRRQ